MNFCRNIGLKSYHVSCASEALDYLYDHVDDIRLVVLDNFLRVDCDGCNMTGCEWLKKINVEYPVNKRSFAVVMTSGHTGKLDASASLADMVLQKPWSPFMMVDFIKDKNIIKDRSAVHAG